MPEPARRLLAGIWFALAAVIPVVYFFLASPVVGDGLPMLCGSLALTAAVPIVVSGFCGLVLAADILDTETVKSAFQAVGRGLMVTGLSYLLMFTISAVVIAFFMIDADDLIRLILLETIFFLYGLFYIGWLQAIVGAAAGWLLYLYRVRRFGI